MFEKMNPIIVIFLWLNQAAVFSVCVLDGV